MNRRDFFKSTGAAVALAAGGFKARAAEARPNVLMIIVDQMRLPRWFPDNASLLGYERLCREGTSFSNHFVSAVPCSPSRACLMTGLHMSQHGVTSNVPPYDIGQGSEGLDPSFTTIGHIFKRAGYRTPYFGKWHLTRHEVYKESGLSAYGFEEWTGPDRDGFPYEGLHRDSNFARQSINWLKQNGNQGPWFLTCSFINPHDVMFYKRLDVPPSLVPDICEELPGNFNDDLCQKPSAQKGYQMAMKAILGVGEGSPERIWRHYLDFYYFLNRKVDMQICRLLDALDDLGLADNTLVVFVSDHGEMAGSHQLQGKGPFVYHENNNVPLVFRWPGQIQAGVTTSALAQNIDLIHTIPELARVTIPDLPSPGKSLVPVLEQGREVNDHVLMSFGYSINDIASPRVISALARHLKIDPGGTPSYIRALYDGRYKFARYFGADLPEEYELYDLQEDALEMHNLAGRPDFISMRNEFMDKLLQYEKSEMAPVT